MERLTETQERRRECAESVIAVMAPFLDLMLAAGEWVSRTVEPVDYEYYPVRSPDGGGSGRSSRVRRADHSGDDR